MGQYGSVTLGVDLQSINLLRPNHINNYYFYYLNKAFLTRMKKSSRYKGQLLGMLLHSPNSKSLELVDIYKRFQKLRTYPKQQTIQGNYHTVIIDIDTYLTNISNAIPSLFKTLDKDITEHKSMSRLSIVNLFEDIRFQNLTDTYYSDTTVYRPPIKIGDILSFSPKLELNLKDTDEISIFFKNYILTYLYQQYQYTDKTFTDPLTIEDKDYYINTKLNYEIKIMVKKIKDSVTTTDSTGSSTTNVFFTGENEYHIVLKSTEETEDSTDKNPIYKDFPITIRVPSSIILPYNINTEKEIDLMNKIYGFEIEYLFEYKNKDDEVVNTITIPFNFILDRIIIDEKATDTDRIITPTLIYPFNDANIDITTIQNNLLKALTSLYINKESVSTNSALYSIPDINLLNISYATLNAVLKLNNKVKEQHLFIKHKCYPVEYYQPSYTEGEVNPNFQGTGWKDIRLYGEENNIPIENFVDIRKKDEQILLQSLNKLGFNLNSFAFQAYRDNRTYYDENKKQIEIQKFPFRNIFNKTKDITIPSDAGGTYFTINSSALFYGLEFNLSAYKGTAPSINTRPIDSTDETIPVQPSSPMSSGEIAYVYHFCETVLMETLNIKELTHLDTVTNMVFDNTYGSAKNNINKQLIVSCTYKKITEDYEEYEQLKKTIKNKRYYIDIINETTGKVYKNNTNYFECIEFTFINKHRVKLNFDNISIIKGIAAKDVRSHDTYAYVGNLSMLSDKMQEGIQLPINITAYLKVPPLLRVDIFINALKLSLYSFGASASVKSEAWVQALTLFANMVAIAVSIFLTVFPPTAPAGTAGLIGSISSILASTGGLIVNILSTAGVIDAKTAMVLNIIFSVASLAGGSASLGVGIANSSLKALDIAIKTGQLIGQTTQLVSQSIEMYYYDQFQDLEKEKQEFQNKVNSLTDKYESIIEQYETENSLNIKDLMSIYYNNASTITPTKYFRMSTKLGFDYSSLYQAPRDISNYVSNCLRLK